MHKNNEPAIRLVEQFVRQNFDIQADDAFFSNEINLWEEGYVDSTGVVELIAFLESEFSLVIPERHLFSPDFTRIDGIARIIDELRQQESDPASERKTS